VQKVQLNPSQAVAAVLMKQFSLKAVTTAAFPPHFPFPPRRFTFPAPTQVCGDSFSAFLVASARVCFKKLKLRVPGTKSRPGAKEKELQLTLALTFRNYPAHRMPITTPLPRKIPRNPRPPENSPPLFSTTCEFIDSDILLEDPGIRGPGNVC